METAPRAVCSFRRGPSWRAGRSCNGGFLLFPVRYSKEELKASGR